MDLPTARLARLIRRLSGTVVPDDRFGSDALPDLEASQWWSTERIREYQSQRLHWIVRWAWEEAPFYRSLMRRHRVRPSTIQGLDDLPAIPIVSRGLLHDSFDRIVVRSQVAETAVSGGTTGHRLRWARTIPWLELFTASLWRGFGWAGVTRETRIIKPYSRALGSTPNTLTIARPFDASKVEEDLQQMRAFEPEAGYIQAAAAYLLARYLIETDRTFPLRSVITSAEMLHPGQRTTIQAAFRGAVFDNYGCNDGGAWGAECPEHDGLHQDFERAIVEFVDGRMVATDLWNTAFPFIRYENGDAGNWLPGSCACGRSSARFTISGRSADLIVTPTQVVFPSLVNRALIHEALLDARVIQHSASEVEVLLVPSDLYNGSARQELEANLNPLLEGMEVTVKIVGSIPPTLSGKHRVSVNLSGMTWDDVLTRSLARTQQPG